MTSRLTGVLEKDAVANQKLSLNTVETVTNMSTNDGKHEECAEMDDVPLSKTASGPPYTIFDRRTRIFIVFMVAVSALISPFAATLYYPALNPLAEQLGVSNSKINLSITTYMICQAVAPAIVASISDTGGRRLSFLICFSIFTVANIGLALNKTYAGLLVLRMIQASGSSGTIALSMAVVADVATSAERGKYNGYATAGILFGPALGPTIGGVLAQFLGWRSIFWFLAIFSGVFLILFGLVFPETCRQVVGNGSIPARGINWSIMGHYQQKKVAGNMRYTEQLNEKPTRKCQLPNPLDTLRILGDKESALLLAYNALAFSGQMTVTAALPSMLRKTYGYNELKVGLCFLPVGSGALLSSIFTGYLMDWNFRRHARKIGMELSKKKQQDLRNFPLERARLEVIWPYHFLTIGAMIGFGWIMQTKSIAGTEVILFILGFVVTGAFNASNTLAIDLHRQNPATATAAINLTRCLVSAAGVSAIIPLIDAIGRGWAFSLIAFLDIALTPALWALAKWGPKWREERILREQEKSEKKTGQDHSRSSSESSHP